MPRSNRPMISPVAIKKPESLLESDRVFFAPHHGANGYFNPWYDLKIPPTHKVLRWFLSRTKQRAERWKNQTSIESTPHPLERFAALEAETKVLWAGHATFLIEASGRRVLIDPIFGAPGGFGRRVVRSPLSADALPDLDAVLLTHGHLDHCDRPTLRKIGRRFGSKTVFIVPVGLKDALPKACREIVEVDWWERVVLGELRATFVPSQHWHRRGARDTNRALWGGWVIEGHHRIYHSGDSGYFSGFSTIGRVFPRIDLALLPAAAYEPRWLMSPQHMNPEESASAFDDLGARRLIPMHWGTFDLSDEALDAGPPRLHKELRERGLGDSYEALKHGETLGLAGPDVIRDPP